MTESSLANPPLVDSHGAELKDTTTKPASEPVDHAAQLELVRAEIENLRQSVATIAATAKSLAAEGVEVTVADLEETLKRNVFLSVGIAAFVGYVWGRTR